MILHNYWVYNPLYSATKQSLAVSTHLYNLIYICIIYIYITLTFQTPLKQRGLVEPPLFVMNLCYSGKWFIVLCAQFFLLRSSECHYSDWESWSDVQRAKQKDFIKTGEANPLSFSRADQERMSKSKKDSGKDFRNLHFIFEQQPKSFSNHE